MWRRLLYLVSGIVAVNLALICGMYLDLRHEDKCDSDTRGLVVWSDERERWEAWRPPLEDSELPPCKGRLQSELKVLPG